MKRVIAALLLTTAIATPAEARRGGGGGHAESLVFVAPTLIPGDSGGMLSLCHLVDDTTALFIPIHRSSHGYALAENQCDTDSFYALEPARMAEAQTLGLIDPSIPATPSLGLGWTIGNYVGYAVMAILVLGGIATALARGVKGKTTVAGQKVARGRRDQLLPAVIDVMCYVAMVDGDVDQSEIAEIARIYKKLTNQTVKQAQIAAQFSQITGPLDIANMAAAFDPQEREILMHAAMMVAVADGKIEAAEYQFIGKLAEGFGLSGDHIRNILAKLAADRNGTSGTGHRTLQPA